jgi:hypothetical protein
MMRAMQDVAAASDIEFRRVGCSAVSRNVEVSQIP